MPAHPCGIRLGGLVVYDNVMSRLVFGHNCDAVAVEPGVRVPSARRLLRGGEKVAQALDVRPACVGDCPHEDVGVAALQVTLLAHGEHALGHY